MDAAVDERVHMIERLPELRRELDAAEDRLVILEVMAEGVCETGLFEPDDGWTPDWEEKEKAKLAACESIRHQFVRMASDSPNVRFLETMEDDCSSELCRELGVTAFPTVVFFKNGQLVWKTGGSARMTGDMSEGLLYYAEGPRLKSSEHVHELYTAPAYDAFMRGEGLVEAAPIKVVMFTTPMCSPCIHVYPSYVTLAMNFAGMMDFARVEMEDGDAGQAELFSRARILEVPTFVLYHRGEEVSRHVSSHRGDLIGHVLQTAMRLGIQPPSPKAA